MLREHLNGALVGSTELLGTSGAVDKETSALNLLLVVEGDETDVGVGEGLGASSDLLEDLGSISAAEHGELPHRPVTVVVVVHLGSLHALAAGGVDVGVLGGRELKAGGPSVADDVVNLLGDLAIGKRGEEREGLEEPVGNRKSGKWLEMSGKDLTLYLEPSGTPNFKFDDNRGGRAGPELRSN